MSDPRARWALFTRALATCATALALCAALAPTASAGTIAPRPYGGLDCNGLSPIQRPIKPSLACTDIRGFANEWNSNTWGGHFYDNGVYIGHDEPDMTFLSSAPGSGNDVTWTETLGRDPAAAPTGTHPGHDISHYFELSPAPWFSMAMCDPGSYPQGNPCTPNSDSNAPTCVGANVTDCYAGADAAFMELQLYPPGLPPFVDSVSCNDSKWCAALTIDELMCNTGFQTCNTACEEPIQFGFIQRNGVPTGPPSPQLANLATNTPNGQTLMMNPGDTIRVHMFDAPAPGGGHAFEAVIEDLSTGQTGWMQASAANGFTTTSITDCTGTPHNYEPEFSTASAGNYVGWTALHTNISTQFETGHFEPCTTLTDPLTLSLGPDITDTTWGRCDGPYEAAGRSDLGSPETLDAHCYPAGYTHGDLHSAPDLITGCQDNLAQNGDLDFDGSPYYPEWPTSVAPTDTPGSFVESLPQTDGAQYPQFFIQTDVALSESQCTATTLDGCTVPPDGPGRFYPYWSRVNDGGTCTLEFGNVSSGSGVDPMGGDAQYGANTFLTNGYPEFEGPVLSNACDSGPGGSRS